MPILLDMQILRPPEKTIRMSNFPWQLLSQKGYGLWYDDTKHFVTEI